MGRRLYRALRRRNVEMPVEVQRVAGSLLNWQLTSPMGSYCDAEPFCSLLGVSASSLPNSNQSLPNNSIGCCARSEPLPQFIESTEQYLSQPQQIRSGCAGCIGNFLAI